MIMSKDGGRKSHVSTDVEFNMSEKKQDHCLGGGSNILYFHPDPWGNDPI